MARKMYKCQFCWTSDWQKAIIAHVICSDGRRYGALSSLVSIDQVKLVAYAHFGLGLQSHERNLSNHVCSIICRMNSVFSLRATVQDSART